MRIVHVITGLGVGGAETMLWKLLRQSGEPESSHVLSLSADGPIGERIRALGVSTTVLGMRPGSPNPMLLLRCASLLRRLRPTVVQTWMYHSDLVGGLAARLAGSIPVVWGIRNSTLDVASAKRSTIWVRRACAILSARLPQAIVSCSQAAVAHHVDLGYDRSRMRVIPNGFDVSQYSPRPGARAALRVELQLPPDCMIVGMAARFHPQKDFSTFLQAAASVRRERPDVFFLLYGDGVSSDNSELRSWVNRLGLTEAVRLLGRRDDLDRIMPGWDIAALSSASGEAFPNALGEAMSCGVPCISTDVGDSAYIVGDTGEIVAPRDPSAFAGALLRFLSLPHATRADLGVRARRRVVDEFSIQTVAKRYSSLYEELTAGRRT